MIFGKFYNGRCMKNIFERMDMTFPLQDSEGHKRECADFYSYMLCQNEVD